MTFGEKLRGARKEAGLSQEQIAEKMNVSRSAVAKWETDKGMPDINNLKVISQLLNVSIDHLLDDDEKLSFNETKKAISLDEYEKTGKCRDKKDAVCLAKNEGASAIYALLRTKKLNTWEHIIDFIAGAGVVDVLDAVNDWASYYLVEKNGKQYLVRIDKEFFRSCLMLLAELPVQLPEAFSVDDQNAILILLHDKVVSYISPESRAGELCNAVGREIGQEGSVVAHEFFSCPCLPDC